jgi:hypothetical protein
MQVTRKFIKVVRSNGKNINHTLMVHLMDFCFHEVHANREAKQLSKKR